MADTHNSPPHVSKNGYHFDIFTYVEGKDRPEKLHLPIDGPVAKPGSIEALRQRLKVDKGY